ncbi:MAG: CPBP family intramembrane metalloprotease [Rhizobacter sp.]|nr:CPBP family intramembrane metalloprotease [Chlorobiales bacterium]
MKKLASLLLGHFRIEVNPLFFSLWILFLTACISFRYFLPAAYQQLMAAVPLPLSDFLFYAFPLGITLLLYLFFDRKLELLLNPHLWLNCALSIFVLFANQYFSLHTFFAKSAAPELSSFLYMTGFNMQSCFFYIIIPLAYGLICERPARKNFYGVTTQGFDAKPYFQMLLFMLPLLVWASFQPHFLQTYPRYRTGEAEAVLGLSPYFTVSVYELSYVLQFVALEIFFRGFIVMVLSRFIGAGAVAVMVSLYVFIHFDKPLAETIGSFFGGYILGVLSLRTGSVLGGMIAHIGVALGMEALAFLQLYVFGRHT